MRSWRNRETNRWQIAAESFFLLLAGGVLYYGLEVLWRGHSHISMAFCGALCLYLLYHMNTSLRRIPFLLRALIGACIITAVEFVAGCVVNLWLGWNVWDYSHLPLQLLGQICFPYFILWFLLCIPICLLCFGIRRLVFEKDV